MVFDSDVNVYGDSNVYIAPFDFRTRKVIQPDSRRKKTVMDKKKMEFIKAH